ncbi:uncharacterized protein [Physcomitrium patens]|uniref:uncharacterized protein isoform X2 n=1 Tax=Physcomitrium patens TaxID=3218 RepID=UPI003CCD0BA9
MRTFLCLGPWWWKKSALHLSPTLVHLGDTKRGASLYLWTRTSKERSRATRTSIRVMIPCEVLPLQWRGRCARWCRCECITDGGGVDAIGLQKSLCVRLQLF